jgi:WD40 repeat protein
MAEEAAVGERVCLRCDWTGETDGLGCPKCGAALYQLRESTESREVTPPPRPQPRPAGRPMPSSTFEADQDDESVPPAAPPAGPGRALVVGALTVVAVGVVTTVWSFNRTQQPAVQPTPAPPAGNAPETHYLIDLNTGEMTELAKSIAGNVGSVSPDGEMVAYESPDDAGSPQVFIARLDGTDVQQLTHDQRGAVDPDWSPDGGAIAYTSGGYTSKDGDVSNIFVLDLATGETSQVTNQKPTTDTCCGPLGAAYPRFSPDGASIVYWVNRGRDNRSECWPGCYGVRIVPVTGGKSVLLVAGAAPGTLSPDGSTLVVECDRRFARGICIAHADGTNPHVLVRGFSLEPKWSPDGTRIAYINLENNPDAIFVVDVATGETTFVAKKGAEPEWLDNHTLIIKRVPR